MATHSPGREDVYLALAEQIRTGRYAPGSKVPSCRELAHDIGSNPNTVHRALKDLEAEGVVRSVPRKGTFVTGQAVAAPDNDWLSRELGRIVGRAVASGISFEQVAEQLQSEIGRVASPEALMLPECNVEDAEEMAAAVAHATGLDLAPVMIDELEATVRAARDDGIDPVVIVPLFHLGEIRALDLPEVPVVDIAFIPDPQSLLQIASLDPDTTVTVASRLPRGVDRLASIVRQYFGGEVVERLLTDEEEDLSGAEVLVHNNASQLSMAERRSAQREIMLSVILEGRSTATLGERIARSVEQVQAGSAQSLVAGTDAAR